MQEISLVFAGGGCRTFWALGAYASLADLVSVAEFAGASAGAAMALAAATGQEEALIRTFCARTAANPRNVYPERLLQRRPVFPQAAMYRGTMRDLLDATALTRLAKAPRVRIQQAYVEPGRPVAPTVARAWWAYASRRRRGLLHGPEAPFPGIVSEVDTAQEATGVEDLIERVMRSSASPPVTPILREANRIYFDGSLVDAVPVRALSAEARAGKVLVLLNRPHAWSGGGESVRYLAPSREVPIHKWDYTSPELVRRTYEMGRRDGEAARSMISGFVRG